MVHATYIITHKLWRAVPNIRMYMLMLLIYIVSHAWATNVRVVNNRIVPTLGVKPKLTCDTLGSGTAGGVQSSIE